MTKNTKTVLFGSLLVVLALSLGGINTVHAQELTAEQETQIDEVGKQIVQLQQDNIKYEQLPDTPEKIELIERDLDRVEVLLLSLIHI